MAKGKVNKNVAIVLILMAMTWAWSFYRLIVDGLNILMENIAGIVDPTMQKFIIVVVFGAILVIWGGKTLEDLLGKR